VSTETSKIKDLKHAKVTAEVALAKERLRAEKADADVPTGGDLIVAVNGRSVTDMADVADAVASRKVGDTITVTVLRDGKSQTVTLTLKDRPADVGRK
jgi:S1-C subfamily serine protease